MSLALAMGVSGCGAGDSDNRAADGGSTDGPPACALHTEPLSVSEGGRLTARLTGTPDGLSATVTDEGALSASISADLELRVTAPYGAKGDHAVTLALACPQGAVSTTLTVTVRPLVWRRLPSWNEGADGPRAREYFAAWIDAQAPDTLYLFGGFTYYPKQFTPASDLWTYDLKLDTWTKVETTNAPLLSGGRAAPIPGSGDVLYYGGIDTAKNATPYSLKRLDLALHSWTDVAVKNPLAVGAYNGAFIHDAPRARYLAVGGTNHLVGTDSSVAAFYPGSPSGRWEALKPAGNTKPSGRTGFFYVHDVETERLIVFGGDQQASSWTPNPAEDTWALELGEQPVRWVQIAGAQTPPLGRRNGACALDPKGHRMFIYGGTRDGQTSYEGLFALGLERGREAWTQVVVPELPESRSSAAMVYDAKRKRILLGFGNGAGGAYADLWALEL